MKFRLLLAVLALGLFSHVFADEKSEYPRVSFVGPGGGKDPVDPSLFVKLVVEGPYLSHDKTPLPDAGVVVYVNKLLQDKNVSYVAVFTREGVKYGDVMHAVDLLRKTNAKSVGVGMFELASGREP